MCNRPSNRLVPDAVALCNLASNWCRRMALWVSALAVLVPSSVHAQQVIRQPEQVLSVSKGTSVLIVNPVVLQRFSIGDPAVAEAVIISPTEVLLNGKGMGTTSLLLWENTGRVRLFSVEVTADAHGLERYLNAIMPEETIGVSATGNMVTLSGQVHDLSAAGRAVDIAKGSGATVIDNMVVPSAIQVMLQVRFAEVSRSVLNQFSSKIATLNPHELNSNGDWVGTSSTDAGVANLGLALLNVGDSLSLILRALQTKGELKTLAEPTLITLPGKEASFLAGGEFPYPTVQGGASGTNAVTIVFKEFGVKLRFTPTLTRNGYIRLRLAPEVSSLDFANALLINGFTVPSLLTRRAETEVEMREGQHLSIAGLLDNSTLQSVAKIPLLGDIPILGQLFRSKDARQRRTELLVIVTPTLVQAGDTLPHLPTGEPGTWKWEKSLRDSVTPTESRH